MKNTVFSLLTGVAVLVLPMVASAAAGGGIAGGDVEGSAISEFMGNILAFIDSIVIPFILAIGFLVFVWGMFKYFIQGGANDDAKESGKSLIMYAIAGYVVILAFWGIVNILSNGLGLEDTLDTSPTATVE